MKEALDILTSASGIGTDGHPVQDPNAERKAMVKRLNERLFDASQKPAAVAPRYTINGITISTPGNIGVVSAPPKTAKSAFLGATMAAAMTTEPDRADCLGVRSSNPDGKALIHFDTEQSKEDSWAQADRAIRRALLTEPPPWFRSHCLTGFSVPDLRQALTLAMEENAQKFGGIHSVVLDGYADMVADVNDPAECNHFASELQAAAIKYDCPIIGVIHFNPGTEKTRGHLGSQLERKAETNLKLERVDDAIVVYAEKTRRAPISKNHGPRFAWDDYRKMFVTVESAGAVKDAADRESLQSLAEEVFSSRPSMRRHEIENGIKNCLRVSDSTAERKASRMVTLGVIRKSVAGLYVLSTPA